MPLRREPIPWRLPYIGPTEEYALREHKLIITPVVSWIDVMEPGDPVELVHPATLVFLSYAGVCYVKKSYIGCLSPIELNIWLPGATRRMAVQLLSEGYKVDLDFLSVVSVIALINCDTPENAKARVEEVVANWSPSATGYLDRFVKDVTGRDEY